MKKDVFDVANVGDKVWSSVSGWGKVTYINSDIHYPIEVVFNMLDRGKVVDDSFTLDGRATITEIYPTLFWQEYNLYPVIEKPGIEIDWSKVPLDTPVEVLGDDGLWINQNFIAYLPKAHNYNFLTFLNGNSSISSETQVWQDCRLQEYIEPKREWYNFNDPEPKTAAPLKNKKYIHKMVQPNWLTIREKDDQSI